LGAPILAEASANLQGLGDLLLRGGERAVGALTVRRVVRIGSVPSWRWWRDLEGRAEVEVLHFSRAPFTGLARDAGVRVRGLEELAGLEMLGGVSAPVVLPGADAALEAALEAFPLAEPAWMRHLHGAMPVGASVFLGNSLPVREWNLAVGCCEGVFCRASRGANGIDGQLSTFLGTAVDHAECWLVAGDLTTLYDLAGPWILQQMPVANIRFVVINNGGGKIFERVKSLQALEEEAREMMVNRHSLNFAHWAGMWGMEYRLIKRPEDLHALPAGAVVLEVVPDEDQTAAFWAAL
jgi:2-succinyl-5-enolpyruvyl-6-hydroxy-3-cyclohexene-1-carboxylate synthase